MVNLSVSVSGLRGLGGGLEALAQWTLPCSEEAALCDFHSLTLTALLWRDHLSSEFFLGLPSLPTPSALFYFFIGSENAMENKNVVRPAASTYALQF